LTNNVSDIQAGQTYGPFITANSTYVSYKISDQYEGTPRLRASHILFSTEGMDDTSKAAVEAQAQTVLSQLKADGNFEVAARQYGQDGTAQTGGDLGWFAKADFVTEFADAAYAAKAPGILPNLVETEYGYHIIKVTEMPKTTYTKVATVELELVASDATRNEAFRNADSFAANAGNRNEFTENATTENYRILQANNVDASARNINNLQNAREVIRWAFTDGTSTGEVSDVFELDNAYIVATLVSKRGEGDLQLADVKEQVEAQVRNEKKAEAIKEKLAGKTSLEDMKAVFPEAASLNEIPDLKLSANVIPGVGFAPRAIGAIFGIEQGKITQPIREDVGVIVGKLNALTPAAEIGDYSAYQGQLTQNASQRTTYSVMMALQDLAGVKDYRYKFF
jgi:peptidyl-prolyl cis-trans isomerase D